MARHAPTPSRKPGSASDANRVSQRRGSAEPAQPPVSPYGVHSTSRLSRCPPPGGRIAGSRTDGTLTRNIGGSLTAEAGPATIAAGGGLTTVVATCGTTSTVDKARNAGGAATTASALDS